MTAPATSDQPSISLAQQVQGQPRPDKYYRSQRTEIADLVPSEPQRVLEVGCGSGNLGALLKSRGHHAAGIELIPEMAAEAATKLDDVHCGDLETSELPWKPGSFDVLICGDVLEHLVDPWQTLRKLGELIREDGLIITSIPNIQNFRIITGLLRGQWEYADSGLLDVGHLRFFTWSTVEDLLNRSGFAVEQRQGLWNRKWHRRMLCWATLGRCEPFFVVQYLVVGRKRAALAEAHPANAEKSLKAA